MTNYTIETAATIYDFDSREEVSRREVDDFISDNNACVEISPWKPGDVNWPEPDRKNRTVVVITPIVDGLRDELSQWVLVVEQ